MVTKPQEITTTVFTVRSSTYMGLVAKEWFRQWWWIPFLAIASSSILGITISIRFLFLSAILLCLVAPLAMLPIYYYSLTPTMRNAIIAKRVSISDKGVKLIFESIDEERPKPNDEIIAWSDVARLRFSSTAFTLQLNGKYRYIIIPYSALTSTDELRQFSIQLHYFIKTK